MFYLCFILLFIFLLYFALEYNFQERLVTISKILLYSLFLFAVKKVAFMVKRYEKKY